jgi:hypothetical protein
MIEVSRVIGCSLAMSFLTVLLVFTLQNASSQSIGDTASGAITTVGGETTYYELTVPDGAVNPRLVGNYLVQNGDTIEVIVLDQEGCPTPLSPFDCTSVYSAPPQDRGDVNVPLTPGKTYYLEFHNDEAFSSKTTNVDFHMEYD